MSEKKYQFIHCHSPIGGVLGRLAAHKYHIPVIYTAHGFHFFQGAPKKNWLLFYPVEWLLSFWTDTLVTINREDYDRAKKHMHAKRILYVPGVGVNLGDAKNNIEYSGEEKRIKKRKKLGKTLDKNGITRRCFPDSTGGGVNCKKESENSDYGSGKIK